MLLLAIDDLDLGDLNLAQSPLVTDASDRFAFGTRRREGADGSMFLRGAPEPAVWNIVFWCDDIAAHDAIMAALAGDVRAERRLLAQRLDAAESRVVSDAAILRVIERNQFDIEVELESRDSVWRAESTVSSSKTFAAAGDRAMAVTVPGNTRTAPRIVLRPVAQRTSSSVYAGWRYRQRWQIANNGDVPMFRHPVRIALGSTTSIVSGSKAQADGDDLRVWLDGVEQPRTVLGMNSANTYLWVVPPVILPGEAITYDLVYGNLSATNPPTLAYPDAPAFTLSSSSNALWVYPMSTDGLGLWALSSGTFGAIPDYSVPGAWRPVRTIKNPDSVDLRYQTPARVVGTSARALLDSGLGGPDSVGIQSLTGFNELDGRKLNDYDGVAISLPFPMTRLRAGFGFQNDNGIAQIAFLQRDSAASEWQEFDDYTATSTNSVAVVAAANYDLLSPARHLAVALWPLYGWKIADDQSSNDIALVESDSTWELTIDDSDLVISQVESEVEIYELAAEIAVGGGESRVPPYRAVLVGNARQGAGAGTPRAAVTLAQALVIDGESGTHEVWSVSGGALVAPVETLSAHAVEPIAGWWDGSQTVESPSSEWAPLAPPGPPSANLDFAASIAGWAVDTTPAGMTLTPTYDGTMGGVANGSLKLAITPSTAASGQLAKIRADQVYAINGRESVDLAAWAITSNVNLTPLLGLRWYRDRAGTQLLAESVLTDWTPVGSTEYEIAFSGRAPALAESYRVLLLVRTDASNQTGTVWFDDVRVNGSDLLVRDEAIGQLAVTAEVRAAWL